MFRTFVRRVVLSVLLIPAALRPLPVLAQEAPAPCAELPLNIEVSELLKSAVSALLRKSPTFRHQCEVIAATRRLRLILLAVPAPRQATAPRATATIGRYSYGLLRIVIEMPVTADHTELIPHEFEHVVEQIEGINLAALARNGDDGVVEVAEGVFETRRAQTAGRTAANEVRGEDVDPAVSGALRGMGRVWRGLASRAAREARGTIPHR